MTTLKKILQEIDKKIHEKEKPYNSKETERWLNPPDKFDYYIWARGMRDAEKIIKKHLSDNDGMINIDDERLWKILFEEACVEGQQADRIHKRMKEICGDGWTAVEDGMPENAKDINAFCPKYQIMTQYGITEGWYNPNQSGWYALFWFMTGRYEESEINFEKGDVPKIVFIPDGLTEKVIAWRSLPEQYRKDGD